MVTTVSSFMLYILSQIAWFAHDVNWMLKRHESKSTPLLMLRHLTLPLEEKSPSEF